MKYLVTFLGVLVVSGFWGFSVHTNYEYGYSLGTTDTQHLKYAILAVCIDILKTLLPFVFAAALLHKKYLKAAMVIPVFTTCVLFSLYAGTEKGGTARKASLSKTETLHTQVQAWQATLARKKAALPEVIDPVSAAEYAARLKAQPFTRNYKRLWKSTKGCTDATAPKSKAFCANLANLGLGQQRALKSEKLERAIEVLQSNIAKAGLGTLNKDDKAQTLLTASLLDMPAQKIITIISVSLAVLVEVVSSIGYWLFLDYLKTGQNIKKSRRRKKQVWLIFKSPFKRIQRGCVTAFVQNSAQYVSGSKTSATSAYSTYQRWCAALDYKPVPKGQFHKRFKTHMVRGNAEHRQHKNGEIVWLDLNLKAA